MIDFSYPLIMGILNITPDSFSDGGLYEGQNSIIKCQKLIKNRAHIIDIGGESTGPGSKEVEVQKELSRIKPVIDYIYENKLTKHTLFSIDTYKAEVAEYALKKGFQIVNDVTALRGDSKMLDILIRYKPYVILMYSKNKTARTTAEKIEYVDVIKTIKTFLKQRIQKLLEVGFPREKIILDPGMGAFISGNPKYSFEIIERLKELKELGFPILIGISRKSCLGGDVKGRDQSSVDWSLAAIKNGADIIRIHNVEMIMKERLIVKG